MFFRKTQQRLGCDLIKTEQYYRSSLAKRNIVNSKFTKVKQLPQQPETYIPSAVSNSVKGVQDKSTWDIVSQNE